MTKANASTNSDSLKESVRKLSSRRWTAVFGAIALVAGLCLVLCAEPEASAEAGAQKGIALQDVGKPTAQIPGSVVSPTKTAVVNFLELAQREATNPPIPKLPKRHEVEPVPETPGKIEGHGPPAVEPKLAPVTPRVASPSPLAQFQGLTDNNTFIPPDVHGAAGPNHLMTTLNPQIQIQTKSGVAVSTVSTFGFWSPLGIGTISDPRVLYDPFGGRWMQTIIRDLFGPNSAICVAVSQTNNPTGTWNLFKIDVDTPGTKWADFPSLGFNKNWIVVSVNMFPVGGGGFTNARTLVCVKQNLYNNTTPAGTFKFFDWNPQFGTIQPAVTMDNTTETQYFVSHDTSSSGTAKIFTVTGPVGSEAHQEGPGVTSTLGGWTFGSQAEADALRQLSAMNISHDEPRWRSVVFRNGAIWGCQQILLPAGGSHPNLRTSVQWWQLTPAGAVTQMGRIDDPTGAKSYAYPSIAVNKDNDVLIGYSRFSATQAPSANYSFRAGTDPLGTLRDDKLLKSGESCYVKTLGGGHNRWGDYSNTVVDPVNDFDMWTIQEYAATSSGGCGDGSGRWATWWAKVASSPTQADLTMFAVKGYDAGQFLQWDTSGETDNLGFNLYRDDRGKRIKLNSEIVAGSALRTGTVAPLSTGRTYGWWDGATAGKATTYWLEEVDLQGESKWHGPVGFEKVGGSPPSQSLAATLSAIGNPRGQAGITRPVGRTASLPPSLSAPVVPLANLPSQPAVKIAVKQEGLYRVTQPQLVAAGLSPSVDPHLLQLYVDGQQQAITVAGESDGSFDASDLVEFYGMGLDVASTDTRVYWLVAGTQPGLRIGQISASGSGPPSGSFAYTVERKQRIIYFASLQNGDKENFFGTVIAGSPVNETLTLEHVDTAASENAIVQVAIQGVTFVSHTVNVLLNGVLLGQVNFDYLDEGTLGFPVAHSMLVEGANVVTLISQNGGSDVNLVDYVRITYRHTFNADGDSLRLTAPGGQPVSIGGFTSSLIRVFDVTEPGSVQELSGAISGGPSFTVALNVPGTGSRTLLALASDQIKSAASLKPNQVSNWRIPTRGADLLIVGYGAFLSNLDPLKQYRQSQGLSVSVVDIEDVYDEFSFGQRTPQALKDFLQYTTTTWKKKPRFVLLAGDASYDSRNYLGGSDFDFVPSKLIDTIFMETSCDDWFADFDLDGIPEIAMGRFPVRTAQETDLLVQKTFAYEKSTRADTVLLVADTPDIYDFESSNSLLVPLLPASVKAEIVNRGQIGSDSIARSQILAAINQGRRIVNYTGHGNVDQWRGNILSNVDAATLTNDRHLSLFVLMTCLNGYFNDPFLPSLAESVLKAPNGGAAAVWASTGQCGPFDQALTNQEFYRLIFNGDPVTGKALTLGEAAVKAKMAINDIDVRRTWVLFGDPSMKFK